MISRSRSAAEAHARNQRPFWTNQRDVFSHVTSFQRIAIICELEQRLLAINDTARSLVPSWSSVGTVGLGCTQNPLSTLLSYILISSECPRQFAWRPKDIEKRPPLIDENFLSMHPSPTATEQPGACVFQAGEPRSSKPTVFDTLDGR